jgi:hypothetical protein
VKFANQVFEQFTRQWAAALLQGFHDRQVRFAKMTQLLKADLS